VQRFAPAAPGEGAAASRCCFGGSLVCTTTYESSWGRCSKTPVLPRAMPAAPSVGARPGALRSRTRGWSRLYSPPSIFFSRRWGLPPPRPRFQLCSACFEDGSQPWATKRFFSLFESQVGAAAPTPPLSAAFSLSCRRLATAENEALLQDFK
jgi:hypothetical protein